MREESFYFYPVFACQIMNEGWASYWHARLLREADFLPQHDYVDAIKCHSDVVRPRAAARASALVDQPVSPRLLDLGEDRRGARPRARARRSWREDDDFAFIRNHLTQRARDRAQAVPLQGTGRRHAYQVQEHDLDALHEALLAPKYSFGAPDGGATRVRVDGTLELVHDHATDGRGLDPERSARVLDYLVKVWRRPIVLASVDGEGRTLQLTANPA